MKPLNPFKTTCLLAFCLSFSQPLFAARPGAFNNQLELFYLVVVGVLLLAANVKQVVQLIRKQYFKLTALFKG